jgi:Cys-tRNA synthase (O-phospho-L-seryl-tRNA:Cys-tRNA synthase)
MFILNIKISNMTVKELIEQLQTLDPDLQVFINGYEGGFNNVTPVAGNVVDMVLDYHRDWFYGKHELAEQITDVAEYKIVKGIII